MACESLAVSWCLLLAVQLFHSLNLHKVTRGQIEFTSISIHSMEEASTGQDSVICSSDEDHWVSFSLTHVRYPRGDRIGQLLAFISLAPFALIISYITLIAFKKELDTVLFFTGQLVNEFINLVLKNIIRQDRPMTQLGLKHAPKTFGMPSQHSQFQTFFTTYAILFIIFKLKYKPWYFKNPLIIALVTSLIAVVYSRVYLMYHSLLQVIVGVLVGISWATVWFVFVYWFFEPRYFNAILSFPCSRFFGLTRFVPPRSAGRKYN